MRRWYGLVALMAVILFGCERPNHPPKIDTLTATPPRVPPGGTSTLTATAVDEDDDPITFKWRAEKGTLSDTIGGSVRWTGPDSAGWYPIHVTADDGRGGTDRGLVTIRVGQEPPKSPVAPSGPTEGRVDSVYTFSAITTDPDDDSIAYQFDWGDGTRSEWTEFVPSGRKVERSHAWKSPRRYLVRVLAKDVLGDTSHWSATAAITIKEFNHPPEIPSPPTGPSSGNTETELTFSAFATDRDNDLVEIMFDWGDNNRSKWSRKVPSGTPVTASHTWSVSGRYEVKARAKDGKDSTDWSKPHTVTITADYPDYRVKIVPLGDCPRGIAALPNGARVYVANYRGQSISVIRTSDNVVIAEIPVTGTPEGIAVLPKGDSLYVTTSDNDKVWVISTSDHTVKRSISVGRSPKGIAALPNGKYLYVVNNGSDAVSVIEVSRGRVVATIPVGGNPFEIAVHPNGEFAYVTNVHSNTVSVIRTSDNTVVATIPVGREPQGIALSPDGGKVYVANYGSHTISVIETSDNRVVKTIKDVKEGPTGVALLPDGKYLYVTKRDNNEVSVIRTSDYKVLATFWVGNSPRAVAVLPNGKNVYLVNHETDNLWVLGYYRP